MSGCCLTPNEHFFQPYHGENVLYSIVLDQHACSDSSLKQQSAW